ncbi:uncharacterized protein LOC127834262 isoform X9 [Dreissena polymorpha]|uniref:Uncharacterized protein n=2 Tax=Dreissena polymorpha TaxID=45954 RepID=A0A9D4JCC1_DREPO|nr:uncharacterized protein LOC127834262 isoform X9 [Dreissena polymorpha]XP_052215936.1 uncharacterized protein LOC127834262 isoform X9 [Dreissena polymorpha]XP_052215937.1 uncharacterized protein LOC127834262 isoform X9 [Dreissena polymorpha]XP_052215938.1 uncharacterized protein LOC127834262 isoform X9 [Dreissena polymorpha]XP_052215939.1 uncharacterized protein LOC127834262 isoform X9 [Dreissena polymorpha]KAH3807756.1 hypothetical protein DPMN_136104 [Dreissena polymorpha]
MTIESYSASATQSSFDGRMEKQQKTGRDGDNNKDDGEDNIGMRQEAHLEPGPSDMTKAIILAAYNDEPEMNRVQFATTPSDDESLPPDPIQFTADEISPVPRRRKHNSKTSQSSKTAESKQDSPKLKPKEDSGAQKDLKKTNN